MVTWDLYSWDVDYHNLTYTEQVFDKFFSNKTRAPNVLVANSETVKFTVDTILPQIIKKFQARGYKLVSVADCLGLPAYVKQRTPPPYNVSVVIQAICTIGSTHRVSRVALVEVQADRRR